jgi:DNA-binding MarR family transcriptional regulator
MPHSTKTPSPVSADVAFRLRMAIGRMARRLRATEAGTDLTPTETSVLFSVVRRGPLGLSELAAVEDLNATMLSRVLAGLVKRGLVERSADPDDRRSAVVCSTEAGADLRRAIQKERAAALRAELARLPDEHRASLVAALPALEALAEQLQERDR